MRPNDLFARAYSLLPIRISVFSSSRTTVASTCGARQRRGLEIGVHALADRRQRARKVDHLAVLGLVSRARPLRMIAMLLPPARIAPGRLHMAVGARANPDVLPRRRNDERSNSVERSRIANGTSLRIAIGERLPAPDAGQPWLPVDDVVQPGGSRHLAARDICT